MVGTYVSPKEQAFGVDKGCRLPRFLYTEHLKIYCERARKLRKGAWRRPHFHFVCLLRKSQQRLVGKISQGRPHPAREGAEISNKAQGQG